jgi:desulfoferrodoxin (superoxide reductase-like protein)
LHVAVTYQATNRHLPAPEEAVTKVALEIPVDDSGIAGVTGVEHYIHWAYPREMVRREQVRRLTRSKPDACV